VTTRGGFLRGWSDDGRQLIYSAASDPTAVLAADVIAGPQFRLGAPRVMSRLPDTIFDVDRKNDRLLLLMPARPLPPQSITVVQNWPSIINQAAH
jgi:hypothetical protein